MGVCEVLGYSCVHSASDADAPSAPWHRVLLGGASYEDGKPQCMNRLSDLKKNAEKHIPRSTDESNNDLWQICREVNIAVRLQ